MYLHVNSDGTFSYPGLTFPFPTGIPPASVTTVNEFEVESFKSSKLPNIEGGTGYSIQRRPVPVEGAREIALPTNVVIDLTTASTALPERSRLPVDPFTGYVDVMIAPNGQVVVSNASGGYAPPVSFPFYHFWIAERDDIYEPFSMDPSLNPKPPFQLPMPRGTGGDPRISSNVSYPAGLPVLKGERRLLSINTRTGSITPTSVETFYVNNTSYPYEAAESGVKESQQ